MLHPHGRNRLAGRRDVDVAGHRVIDDTFICCATRKGGQPSTNEIRAFDRRVFSNPPSRPLPFGRLRNETLTRPRDSRALALADSYCSVSPKLLNLRCLSPLNHFVSFVLHREAGGGWSSELLSSFRS